MDETKISNNAHKERVINDLKKTAKDMPLLVRWALQPVISYIEKKYDNMPDQKKEHIQKMINDIKSEGNKWLWKVKEIIWKFMNKWEEIKKQATEMSDVAKENAWKAKKQVSEMSDVAKENAWKAKKQVSEMSDVAKENIEKVKRQKREI